MIFKLFWIFLILIQKSDTVNIQLYTKFNLETFQVENRF